MPSAGVAERCESLCAMAEQKCDAASVEKWRATCRMYLERSRGCEKEYERALECQGRADAGELCTQVASVRCSDEFRAIKACERGDPPAEPRAPSTALASWVPIEDGALRWRALLPPGAERDTAKNAWRGTEGEISYAVHTRAAPRAPLTEPVLVRLVIEFVGYTCQKGLRLFGRYEAGGETALRFSSSCHDGREWQGMLRVWNDRAFAQTALGRAGATPVPTEFFESFRRLPVAAPIETSQQ